MLLITITALANEVAKNLVLAGIGSITLLDPDAVTEEDLGAQFLVAEEDVGRNVRVVSHVKPNPTPDDRDFLFEPRRQRYHLPC